MTTTDIEQRGEHLRREARTLKIELPASFGGDTCAMTWDQLHDERSAGRAILRSLRNKANDKTPEAEATRLERVADMAIDLVDQCDVEFERREKAGTRNSLRPIGADGEARGDGGPAYVTREGWTDDKGGEVRVIARDKPIATERPDGPGFGAIARAMIIGPRDDTERRALAGGTDSAGGYTVPSPLAANFIDKMRAKSVVIQAGAQTVQMTSDELSIARLATDPTVSWLAENGSVTDSSPTFERVLFSARKLIGLVKISRELFEDSVNVDRMIENAFAQAMALEVDRVALFGSGSGAEPLGLFGTTGINSVSMGTNGAAITNYDPFIDALYETELDNAATPTAAIFHPRTAKTLYKLKDADTQPLNKPPVIANLPMLTTTSVPINQTQGSSSVASTILQGDFTQLLIGMRMNMRIELLKELYAGNYQYGLLCAMRVDVQVAQPPAFCKVIGVL